METSSNSQQIAALRRLVDLPQYSFPKDAPAWLLALNKYLESDLGTLAILGPNGVAVSTTSGVERVNPDPLSLSLAALVSNARDTGQHTALGLPPGARHIPLLIASVAILADALKLAQNTRSASQESALSGVLVVSKDLDIRSRYCDLRVKNETLDKTFPGSRMNPEGEQIPLRPNHGRAIGRGVCFFLPPVDLPNPTFRPALAIIDLRYAQMTKRAKELVTWVCRLHQQTEVLAIYTIGDRDTAEILSRAQFKDIPIDHAALATCADLKADRAFSQSGLDCNLIRKPTFLERQHEIIPIIDQEVEELFLTTWHMIDQLKAHESSALNRARWILATVSHLPIPLVWYERTAQNLGRSTLRRLADRLSFRYDSGTGAAMQALKMQFERIHLRLSTANPLANHLHQILPSLVQNAAQTVILVRDRTIQRALQSWFDLDAFPNASWLRNVEICSCPDYAPIATRSYSLALVIGTLPRRYRWIAGGALGDSVKFLAYPSEVDSIESQLQEIYGEEAIRRRANERERVLSGSAVPRANPQVVIIPKSFPKLDLKKPAPCARPKAEKLADFGARLTDLRYLGEALEAAKIQAERAFEQKRNEQSTRRAAWEDGIDEDPQEDVPSEAETGSEPHPDDIPCIKFDVRSRKRGSGRVWLPPGETVERLRPSDGDDIAQVMAHDLRTGDVLILIEEDARGDLFDRVVLLTEDQPEWQYLARFRKQWQQAMRLLASEYDCVHRGYAKLYAAFKKAGSTITTEVSVANWVLGRVMGPDHPSSIRAAGRLSHIESLDREAVDFDKAFQTIRSIHRALGRRLSHLIRRSSRLVTDPDEYASKETLDDHIWLPVTELLETVDLAEVTARGLDTVAISPGWVGRFFST